MSRLIILAAVAALGGCGVSEAEAGSAANGSRSFATGGFDRVSLRGSDDVIVRVGPAASVSATGPDDILDKLEVKVVDGELRVGRKREGWGMNWGKSSGHAVFTVTLPRIRAAAVAGSGDMKVDRVQANAFEANIAGSGNLAVGQLQAESASVNIAGSGNATIVGQARSLDISIAGSGDLSAPDLKSERANISIAGSGDVRAFVTGSASVSIIGSGDVVLGGNPRCETSKMGSGDVRCGA